MSYVGVVKSFGFQKGYGFIQCEQLEGDVFMGRQNMPPDLRDACSGQGMFNLQGLQVSFDLAQQDGKQSATNVIIVAQEGATIVGRVKSYNDQKGYGFMTSDSVDGGDIFFGRRDILSGVPSAGAVASLNVALAQDGRPQGRSVNIKQDFASPSPAMASPMGNPMGGMRGMGGMGGGMGGGMMGMGGMGWMPTGKGMGKGMMPAGKGAPMMHAAPAANDSKGTVGTVKSYNEAKGYGFLSSPSMPGGDVYFKGQPGEVYEQGSWWAFNVQWTPDGKPQARNVVPGLEEGQTYTGTVRSFVPRKGYGFIQVPDQPIDVFLKKEVITPPVDESSELAGVHVNFTVAYTPDGKAQASTAQLLDHAPPDYTPPVMDRGVKRPSSTAMSNGHGGVPAAFVKREPIEPISPPAKRFKGSGPVPTSSKGGSGQVRGVVKSYNPSKGWGFIQSPASAGDVFFKRSDLPLAMQQNTDLAGSACAFSMEMMPDGKARASSVQMWG